LGNVVLVRAMRFVFKSGWWSASQMTHVAGCVTTYTVTGDSLGQCVRVPGELAGRVQCINVLLFWYMFALPFHHFLLQVLCVHAGLARDVQASSWYMPR
jgi:hypothetical protein